VRCDYVREIQPQNLHVELKIINNKYTTATKIIACAYLQIMLAIITMHININFQTQSAADNYDNGHNEQTQNHK